MDGAAVVGGEDHESVLPHALGLEGGGDAAHHLVHEHNHGRMLLTTLVLQVRVGWVNRMQVLWRPRDAQPLVIREAELLVVRFWDLQREMGHVRRVEEEQGRRGVVALHEANQLLLVQELGEICAVHIRRTPVGSPQIDDRLIVLAAIAHIRLAPVVVVVCKVVQAGVVAPAVWCVCRSRHAGVPLAGKMGLVPSLLHLLRQPRHVVGDARVVSARIAQLRVDVHWQASRLQRSPRGGANLVHVMPLQMDAAGRQTVQVGSDHFRIGLLQVETDIGPAKVIHQHEEDVWLRQSQQHVGQDQQPRQAAHVFADMHKPSAT
mmetsp:Transcript_75374/g.180016  ORF Transcript_75374/g.180016 Transcript_75374/m.180016 type:complete len:319 (+) Transcript_75374:705-1661(+)